MNFKKRTLIALQGIPGAGKSTVAKQLVAASNPGSAAVVSADDYHMENGVYNYKTEKAGDAHGQCLRAAINLLADSRGYADLVIVDNTNTTVAEVAPYIAVAEAYGWDARILKIPCDWETAAKRTIHGVPSKVVLLLHQRLDKFLFEAPTRWKYNIWTGDIECLTNAEETALRTSAALRHLRVLTDFAYKQGFHELGYDPVGELAERLNLPSPPSED